MTDRFISREWKCPIIRVPQSRCYVEKLEDKP